MSEVESPRIFMRKELKEEIDKEVNNYFMTSYNTAKFPYAVLDIKELDDELYIPYMLEIEVWDQGDDTTQIEIICDNLKKLLDKKRVIKNNYAYVIFFSNCITNIDEDKTIKRRLLTFNIHLYKFI